MTRVAPFLLVMMAILALATACSSDDDGAAKATPTPAVAASATPLVMAATTTPAPWRTVVPQDAASAGRNDCPTDWAAYRDPQDRFSICYPADFGASASDVGLSASDPKSAEGDLPSLFVGVSWNASSGYGLGPPSAETCARYTDIVEGPPVSSEFVELSFGDRTGIACFTVGRIQSSLHGVVLMASDGTGEDGYVQFRIAFTAEDLAKVPDEAEAILETLRVALD